LVWTGERAGAGADGATDQRTFQGRADHPSPERPNTRADSGAAHGTVASAVATGTEGNERKQRHSRQSDLFHDLSPDGQVITDK
jgi:hypothetical protein